MHEKLESEDAMVRCCIQIVEESPTRIQNNITSDRYHNILKQGDDMKTPKIIKGYDGSLLIYSDGKRYIQLVNGQIIKEETYQKMLERR